MPGQGPDPDRVFVYGTLRPGFTNPGRDLLQRNSEHLGAAWTRGRLLIVQGLPALIVDAPDKGTVVGDLYRLEDPQAALEGLDRYEGVRGPAPGPYQRQLREVVLEGQDPCRAWVYVWTGPTVGARPVPEGDYRAYADP